MDLRKVWDQRAAEWRDWARTPGHDSYWAYSDSFFLDIVPKNPGTTLEIGCGEGRVTRRLVERSTVVVAVDTSPTLIAFAADADEAANYTVADATILPFKSDIFDTVVAYNSLMDLDDMPKGAAEAGRVLKSGGHFCVCVLHPLRDAGHFTSEDVDAPFGISHYFESRRYEESFERNGLQMTFTSWHHPLGEYSAALERSGFLIERLTEPVPDASKKPELQRSHRIPMFLFLRALKP